MLSHTIDLTQRGDESIVCGRTANYVQVSGNRIPRHARLRRQIEAEEAATSAAEEQKSEEGNPDLTQDAEPVPADDTEKELQSSAENSENTSKHVPDTNEPIEEEHVPDTNEPKEEEQEGHKSDTAPEQQAEVVNQTAKYVILMYVCPCIVV